MRERILIVEDNQELQEMFRVRLEMEGFRLSFANNGQECLETLEQALPDLILLDLFMPVMDGYQVLEVLNVHPEWDEIPVVVFSIEGDLGQIERAVKLGAVEFLPKGKIELDKVVDKIKIVLEEERLPIAQDTILELLIEKGIIQGSEFKKRFREKKKEVLLKKLRERRF